ncbi:two-component system cell cycle response regulator [Actimicrobium sp. GrIS 1.19]|uniref:diguanylate cyclase domain-containing protein n=1 Tax=Actimicrobium sp. GrIS 1.19 TaxID=3071708 RepID=UPI002DFC5F0C|nr:two-component system cell cycle response regulator [Actimicrobium sp. GrIS 1.19]
MILSTDALRKAKILIVDDGFANIDLLQAILEREGYTNVSATTLPHDVAALHQHHQYDLILLDLEMPGLDGFGVMAQLHKLKQDDWLPVLAISARIDCTNQALEAGAKDFIGKPYDVVELVQRIRNSLEVRLLYKEATRNREAMRVLALHDPLTGLPNRRLLKDRIASAIEHAKRKRNHVAVLYIDLDGFKDINDTLGHDVGDALLQMVATRLLHAARGEDTVARIGGDEFMMLLGEMNDPADVHVPAQKLLREVAEPYLINGTAVSVTSSIGISIYPFNARASDALINLADAALYEAKGLGKNRYQVADAQFVDNMQETDLRPASSRLPKD